VPNNQSKETISRRGALTVISGSVSAAVNLSAAARMEPPQRWDLSCACALLALDFWPSVYRFECGGLGCLQNGRNFERPSRYGHATESYQSTRLTRPNQ
jgi:hypothetical protein